MNESRIPELLQEIPDAPKKLYIRGTYPDQKSFKFLTVVGSRKYTQYGKSTCEKIISELSTYPIVIVSGLALGIDTIAHKTALENKMLTIAVPGSGLDDSALYPSSNRNLAHKILDSGGCLLSELEPTAKAASWTFPRRNRIMAGISHAILVIEAENISGTRITARLATEYNRDVFSVPGSIFSSASDGCNQLIKEGAYPITCAGDIIEHFGFTNNKEAKQRKLFDLSQNEKRILEELNVAQSKSELARKMNMNITELNICISSMEIQGLIKESLGKIHKENNI